MRRLIQGLDSSPTSHCHLYSTGIKILHRYWCAKSVISAVQIPRASREAQAAKEQRAHFCGRRRTTCTCANHGIVSSVVRTAIHSDASTKRSAVRVAPLLAHQRTHESAYAQSSRGCRDSPCIYPDLTLATGAVGQHQLVRHRCDASPACAAHCTMKFAVHFPNVRTDIC